MLPSKGGAEMESILDFRAAITHKGRSSHMSSPSRPPFTNAKLIQSFRGEARAPLPLHPLEWTLVVIASLQLAFLPWALGGREVWAQVLSFVLGLAALVVALLPRRYEGDLAPQGDFVLHPWPRLLRFPIFWLGLLLLGYVTCQALNPAAAYASAGPYWWLVPKQHVEWLPIGIEAPFGMMNAWRMLLFMAGPWALACALWIGITRRSAVQAVLNAVIINGALLALIGILQKVTGATKVLWFIEPITRGFVATFFYENYAGAYLNTIVGLTAALMSWHHLRALRRLDRSSPAPVYAFAVVLLASLVFMSNSRAAMILLAAYLAVSLVLYLFWRLGAREGGSHPAVAVVLGVVALGVAGTAFWFLNLDEGVEQIRELASKQERDVSVHFRVLAREAALDLHEARPLTGWGAGAFRHVFPSVQKNYPEIDQAGQRKLTWVDPHNDYVHALTELGILGLSLPVLMLGWLVVKTLRSGLLRNPPYILGFVGLGLPMAHAWVDSPLQSAAIFVTLCAGLVLLTRWLELETTR